MPRHLTSRMLACIAAFAAFVGSAAAQSSTVTFSAPVQLSEAVLEAGTYTLQAAGNYSVIVLDDRGIQVAAARVSPIRRPAREKGVVVLGETDAGRPPRVVAWYPTDGRNGLRFFYRQPAPAAPARGR